MTAPANGKDKPVFENPLMPHARMRQIARAMVQARVLEKGLSAARRGRALGAGAHALSVTGLEACLVSASVDLGAGDLVSDALSGGVVEFLRGAGLKRVIAGASTMRGGVRVECGAAGVLPAGREVGERLWVAMGAAAGMKAATGRARLEKKDEGAEPVNSAVVVVYVRAGEVAAAVWRKALEFAAKEELPMVFVVMPPAAGRADGGVSTLAMRCGVPGIAVDGDDAVAIYRVAQESIGRARAGGGAALMECVPFVLAGAKAGRADAIAGMESYMVQRGVVGAGWCERERKKFARGFAAK